ncbi:MAG TPA: TRAP transporter TatT component family protein [Kiritimatiellia bacterium]|nr:TRAP transporter TatT component family protein [Kiritimatiellia bacterium]
MKLPIHLLGAALLLAAGFGGSGCLLVRKGAAKIVTPVAMELSDGFMRQTDVELVREGAPAFLLMLDALAEAHPEKPAVLIAAAEAQMAYAMGFLDKAQKERAKTMFLKAKTYGLRALSFRNRRFARALEGGSYEDFVHALGHFRKKDADALLATATSWVMWIIASSDSPAALGDMPKVLAMMERVKELDPRIRQGGVDLFYGIYYTVLPLGGGRDLAKARRHFERSIAVAGPDYLLNRVTFAEYYARYALDQELFERTLRNVLAADPAVPEFTLMNAVAQTRARALLAQMDDLF